MWVRRVSGWRGRLATLAAVCIALAAPSAAGADEFDDVQASLDALVEPAEGPPGASALIQRGDKVRFLRAGVADLRNDRAFHRRDFMRIASVSKAYSGAVALSLVDQELVGAGRHAGRAAARAGAGRLVAGDAGPAHAAHERGSVLHGEPGVPGRPRGRTRSAASRPRT